MRAFAYYWLPGRGHGSIWDTWWPGDNDDQDHPNAFEVVHEGHVNAVKFHVLTEVARRHI